LAYKWKRIFPYRIFWFSLSKMFTVKVFLDWTLEYYVVNVKKVIDLLVNVKFESEEDTNYLCEVPNWMESDWFNLQINEYFELVIEAWTFKKNIILIFVCPSFDGHIMVNCCPSVRVPLFLVFQVP
jgi:hypothetical protein